MNHTEKNKNKNIQLYNDNIVVSEDVNNCFNKETNKEKIKEETIINEVVKKDKSITKLNDSQISERRNIPIMSS